MYFYRLLTPEELLTKQIHYNENKFDFCENTHKYIKGKNYIHLFLNAESCFEDFEKPKYDQCLIAKFNIPDSIVCKYGIGLGGYSSTYNYYNKKYRNLTAKDHFWLPEIAIISDDFDYHWCEEVCRPIDEQGYSYLPENFITDDIYYREIIYDGYLLGYKNKEELLKKYKNIIKLKKHIINVLKTTKTVSINPNDVNIDSVLAYYALVNYAKKNGYVDDIHELKLIISNHENLKNICISSSNTSPLVINKQYNCSNPEFCSKLEVLGIKVDRNAIINNLEIQKIKKIGL